MRAKELGFDACRITSPNSIPLASERLAEWLKTGGHGDMGWMEETAARRADPRALWPDVRSIIMLGLNYGPDHNPLINLDNHSSGNLSVYARHRDYHDLIKGKLKTLAGWIVARAGGEVKVFVDTAPVMEKPLAMASGMGWQGKHTNLVSREFGSWLFLGCIFSTLDIEPDAAEIDHCGTCQACLDICPTKAFPAPFQLDARRCISYLTIEHKGHIGSEFRGLIGNRIYGCDDCLAVCPWNKYAKSANELKLIARDDLKAPNLADLAKLDESGFRALFSGSPVNRAGYARFLRNVLIAIGNSRDRGLADSAKIHLDHASPLVRAMAVWACSKLLPMDDFTALRALNLRVEEDAIVRCEWTALP